jgi:hypothetical protein
MLEEREGEFNLSPRLSEGASEPELRAPKAFGIILFPSVAA